jgi:hypothetical protein
MSNILAVTMKPPKTLMKEMKAAVADKPSTKLVGWYPPPIKSRPPTAVIPENDKLGRLNKIKTNKFKIDTRPSDTIF